MTSVPPLLASSVAPAPAWTIIPAGLFTTAKIFVFKNNFEGDVFGARLDRTQTCCSTDERLTDSPPRSLKRSFFALAIYQNVCRPRPSAERGSGSRFGVRRRETGLATGRGIGLGIDPAASLLRLPGTTNVSDSGIPVPCAPLSSCGCDGAPVGQHQSTSDH